MSSQIENTTQNNDEVENIDDVNESISKDIIKDQKPNEDQEPIEDKEPIEAQEPTRDQEATPAEQPVEDETRRPEAGKKKRLTLQERLALAAQKSSKTTEKPKTTKDAKDAKDVKSEIKEEKKQVDEQNIDDIQVFDQFLNKETNEQRNQFMEQLQKYVRLKIENNEKSNNQKILTLENKLKSHRKSQVSKATNSSKENDLLKKLKEKEDQICDLLEEGTKLSKKELTLNQTIKKLKAHELELEEDLESHDKKIEELTNKLDSIEHQNRTNDQNERLLIEEKLARETLQSKYDSLVRANDSLTDELKEIKFSKLDEQLEKAQHELSVELKENELINDKYNKLELLFNQFKNENKVVVGDLKVKLAKEIDSSRDKSTEIKRLEEKIESLRFQNENSISIPKVEKNNTLDIIKLQYEEAQENWKLIESSYVTKINDLETKIDELTNINVIYSKKIKVLTNDLKQKSNTITEVQENNQSFMSEIETLTKKINTLTSTNATLEENIQQLKLEFSDEKENFEKKIRLIEEEKNNFELQLKVRTTAANNPPSQIISQNSFYLQDLSSSSSLNFLKSGNLNTPTLTLGRSFSNSNYNNNNNNSGRYSIQVGESSTTPRMSSFQKLNSILPMTPQDKILKHQNSMISIDSTDSKPLGINMNNNSSYPNLSANIEENDVTNPDEFLLESPNVSRDFMYSSDDIPLGMDAESGRLSTINGNETPINNSNPTPGLNIQLIKRLSSHIRTLELEINTSRDEISRLENDKEATNNEILKLLSENKKVEELRDQMDKKDNEIANLNKNYEKVLVLLGEKEERVGELNADVDDLKDLLRQQVQQMVEMQEKLNSM